MTQPASTGNLEFRFQLDKVEDIKPWVDGSDRKLHWFGLTWGRFWIVTPLGDVLQYSEQQAALWRLDAPFVDYYVAQLFQDLQVLLPAILEPVPSNLAALVSDCSWFARCDHWIDGKDERRALFWEATDWYHERLLNTGYLINGPSFHLWRSGDDISIRWELSGKEPDGMWVTPEGQFTLGVEQFKSAVFTFLDGVLTAMQEQVRQIEVKGWPREDCRIDIPLLVKEQRLRADFISTLAEQPFNTDWDHVRKLISRLPVNLQTTARSQ